MITAYGDAETKRKALEGGAFRSGRNFSAWVGLVPKQHSSGGKDRLGSISKQGDRAFDNALAHITPVARRDLVYAASAMGSL